MTQEEDILKHLKIRDLADVTESCHPEDCVIVAYMTSNDEVFTNEQVAKRRARELAWEAWIDNVNHIFCSDSLSEDIVKVLTRDYELIGKLINAYPNWIDKED